MNLIDYNSSKMSCSVQSVHAVCWLAWYFILLPLAFSLLLNVVKIDPIWWPKTCRDLTLSFYVQEKLPSITLFGLITTSEVEEVIQENFSHKSKCQCYKTYCFCHWWCEKIILVFVPKVTMLTWSRNPRWDAPLRLAPVRGRTRAYFATVSW